MYDKHPYVAVANADECLCGWEAIGGALRESWSDQRRALCVECYPGVFVEDVCYWLTILLKPSLVISTEDLLLPPAELNRRVAPILTDDPVFGVMNGSELEDFFDPEKLQHARLKLKEAGGRTVLIIGTGAALIAPQDRVLVYADLARWEIQQRQRRGEIGNLGADNAGEVASQKYKRAYFLDWRAADRMKRRLLPRVEFLLDTNMPTEPKMISGAAMREGLRLAVERPFRVVPFFDPGPWGGHWMQRVFNLPAEAPNYAWCFDCVPEENSLLLGFGDKRVEIPSIDLVLVQPRELLGDFIYESFGAEFPIRFDLLDTVGGGNLSLQVHPLTGYVRERFGLAYTQDESYYLLDAEKNANVYLGVKEGIDHHAMLRDLNAAQHNGSGFDVDRYVSKWPAKKHDHFLIPAGTVHCSGAGSLVLEISATPYIFTFKLWDWGRLGLDGQPRPIHLQRGIENIQWDRTTAWVKKSLINRVEEVAKGDGWREERTGLHELEFIETRRHWFTEVVPHDTNGTVNVLNLVEGEEAVVESPSGAFQPFVVHYAETFIVPAQAGSYTIRPHGNARGKQCATVKAFVRDEGLCAEASDQRTIRPFYRSYC
jgi:mannose-6-phosphate isomerase class I